MSDELWIDTETGTVGMVDSLRIVDGTEEPREMDFLNEMSDIERQNYGGRCGVSIEDIRTDAYEQGEQSGKEYQDPDTTNALAAHEELRGAVTDMLLQLDIDGTCQLCEMSFHFHAADCAIHPVNNALDRMEF